MRPAFITTLVFIAWGHATTAQKLSLTPQTGLEKNRTSIRFNDLSSFSPLCQKLTPQVALRMNYEFKKGHGPYVSLGTTRHIIALDVVNPENISRDLNAARHAVQFRTEAGYQFSSKPISLKRSANTVLPAKTPMVLSAPKKQCGDSYVRSKCGKKESSTLAIRKIEKPMQEVMTRNKNKGWSFRIQPAVGAAYVPALKQDVVLKNENSAFTYKAGNYDLAFVSRVGFEFAKNRDSRFTLGIQYLRGLGNLDTRTVSTASGTKTNITQVRSSISSWSLTAGVPISLYKKQPVKKQQVEPKRVPSKCGQYKMRYTKSI